MSARAILILKSLCYYFAWMIYLLARGVLKSHTTIVSGPIYPFMFTSVCFMKLGAHLFSTYIFTIPICPGWFATFINIWLILSCSLSFRYENRYSGYSCLLLEYNFQNYTCLEYNFLSFFFQYWGLNSVPYAW
jgi:hypothetical protein